MCVNHSQGPLRDSHHIFISIPPFKKKMFNLLPHSDNGSQPASSCRNHFGGRSPVCLPKCSENRWNGPGAAGTCPGEGPTRRKGLETMFNEAWMEKLGISLEKRKHRENRRSEEVLRGRRMGGFCGPQESPGRDRHSQSANKVPGWEMGHVLGPPQADVRRSVVWPQLRHHRFLPWVGAGSQPASHGKAGKLQLQILRGGFHWRFSEQIMRCRDF